MRLSECHEVRGLSFRGHEAQIYGDGGNFLLAVNGRCASGLQAPLSVRTSGTTRRRIF